MHLVFFVTVTLHILCRKYGGECFHYIFSWK